MSNVVVGSPVPDFTIAATGESLFTLSDLKGQNVVLYFYPKDNTPGCTTESVDFTTHYEAFVAANTRIFGVSRDSIKSHENFKTKFSMPFELLSDQDEAVCQLFDVIKEKNMYGRKSLGVERSTFLIDKNGILQKEWRKVKVKGHVEEVLAAVLELN